MRGRQIRLTLFLMAVVAVVAGTTPGALGEPWTLGLQAPPLRYPSLTVGYALSSDVRVELRLTHQRSPIRRVTRVGLAAERALPPIEQGAVRLVPTLGLGAELGWTTVRVEGASSTTPVAAFRLIGGAAHELAQWDVTLVAHAWNAVSVQPVGLGWGVALGVRTSLPLEVPLTFSQDPGERVRWPEEPERP